MRHADGAPSTEKHFSILHFCSCMSPPSATSTSTKNKKLHLWPLSLWVLAPHTKKSLVDTRCFRDSAPMLPIHPKGLRNVQISLVNLHGSYSVSSLNFSRVTVIIYFLAMQNMYGMQTKNIKTYVDSIRKYISKDGSANHE